VRDTACDGETDEFMTTKVPRQYQVVLLVKVCWRRDKAFGSEKGRDEEWSKEEN
jgi:hypothetical protein